MSITAFDLKALNLFRFSRASYSQKELHPSAASPFDPVGPVVISICVFAIGLLFWITVVFAYVPLTLVDSREFWLGRLSGGWTLFEAYVFVCLLLGYWILFFLIRHWIKSEMPSLPVILLYFMSAVVIGRVGYSLYVMRTTVLNDQLFSWMQENQDVQRGRYYFGRVRNESPESCESVPEPCVLVELEDGRFVLAALGPRLDQPKTEIVIVDSMVGERTREHYYYQVDYYFDGDTEYRWHQLTGQ